MYQGRRLAWAAPLYDKEIVQGFPEKFKDINSQIEETQHTEGE